MPHVTYDCRPTAFIEPVLVSEAHRRQGIARLMFVSHKRHADDGAFAFYRSLGFDAEAEGFRLYLQLTPPSGSQATMKTASTTS